AHRRAGAARLEARPRHDVRGRRYGAGDHRGTDAGSEPMTTIRKTVTLIEEINSEYGAPASPPLRRVAIAAVFENPLAGKATGADLNPLIDFSLELGAS